jgi:ABC-type sugar transport system, periplasmic component
MKAFVKGAALVAAVVLSALSLSGCGGGKAASSGPVKVQILVGFGTGTDDSQQKAQNALAEEFNASHKDIQVEFAYVQYDEHDSKFTAMLAGGMSPDLVMPIGVMGVATYQDEWLDIGPYIKRDKLDLADFYGTALDTYKFGNKIVGLPFGVYPSAIAYNADLFDKGKQAYPPHQWGTKDWTYDAAMRLAMKLTVDDKGRTADQQGFNADKTKLYGFALTESLPWRVLPAKFGGNTYGMSADFKKAQMNTPEWKAAAKYLRELIFVNKVLPKYSSQSGGGSFGDSSPLGSNKCAFWEIHSWMSYEFEQWNANMAWDLAAIPAGPTGAIAAELNTDTFVIPKSSKHHDQAWEVAKWFLQPEIMKRLSGIWGCIPSRQSLASGWKDGMMKVNPKVDWQVFIDSMKYAATPNYEAWVPNYKKVWDAMEKFGDGVTTGTIVDTDKGLDDLNAEVQGYLDEYWKSKK